MQIKQQLPFVCYSYISEVIKVKKDQKDGVERHGEVKWENTRLFLVIIKNESQITEKQAIRENE